MADSIVWWLALEAVGLAAFPFAFLLFRWLPDRGYATSKVLGLLLLSYALWIGGTIHLLPFHRASIAGLLALMALASLYLLRRRPEVLSFFREHGLYVGVVEALFAAILGVGLWLRAFTPEISFGEKVADLAFINAILRTRYFPFDDLWLAGEPLHWYYFGHINVAALTKLTGIPASITFNLAAVSMAALGGTAAFGIVYNLIAAGAGFLRKLAFAGLTVVFLLLLTNIEGTFEILAANDIGSQKFYGLLDIYGLNGPLRSDNWYPTDFWWIGRAVQIASNWDLREFPFFSLLSGDLHAHLLGVPFHFLALALLLDLWRSDLSLDGWFWRRHPVRTILMALVLGAVGFAETWDLPALLLLLGLVALARNYGQERRLSIAVAWRSLAFALPIVVLALVAFAPYHVGLDSVSSGPRPIEVEHRAPWWPLDNAITRPHHFIYAWLPFTWLMLTFTIVALAAGGRGSTAATAARGLGWWPHRTQTLAAAASPALIPLALWTLLILVKRGPVGLGEEVAARNASWVTWLLLGTLMALAVLALRRLALRPQGPDGQGAMFALMMGGVGLLLLFGMDFFWIDDPIGTRYNTLFRLGYQAWLFLSVATAYGLYYVVRHWPLRLPVRQAGLAWLATAKTAWVGMTVFFLALALVYPLPATLWRTVERPWTVLRNGDLTDSQQTLDGLAYIQHFNPDLYAAIQWLEANGDDAIILQAVGDDYQAEHGLLSAATGVPTVLTWPTHIFRWHDLGQPLEQRKADVATVYQTLSQIEAMALLEKYGVDYVFVGPLERERYGRDGLLKFERFFPPVFRSPTVTIYQVPQDGQALVQEPWRGLDRPDP